MYFIGFNVPHNCSMEDPVEDLILKMKLNNEKYFLSQIAMVNRNYHSIYN
jgi:hypothetical protein